MTGTTPRAGAPGGGSLPERLAYAVTRQRSGPARFGIALGAMLVAVAITVAARSLVEPAALIAVWPAALLAALAGGAVPALVASALGVLGVQYLTLAPGEAVEAALLLRQPALPVIVLASGALGWLADNLRDARLRATDAAHDTAALAAQLAAKATQLQLRLEDSHALQEELEHSTAALARANDDLRRTRDFLEQAQSSAELGSWEWDIAANRVTWSDQLFRVYGREPGSLEISFESYLELIHPDDRQMVGARVEEAYRTRRPFSFDHRIEWPDGTLRWVHGRGRLVVDSRGRPIRMIGSGQDITDRRRAAEAQRMLAEAFTILSRTLDRDATLEAVADLAVRAFGDWCFVRLAGSGDEGTPPGFTVAHRDPDRAAWVVDQIRFYTGQSDLTMAPPPGTHPTQGILFETVTRDALRSIADSEAQLRVLVDLRPVSMMVVPMTTRGRWVGEISVIAAESRQRFAAADLSLAEQLAERAAVALDNVELYRNALDAEARAVEANRTKTQFLAAMSHELRTPLNVLFGYRDVLQLEIHGPLTDGQRQILDRVERTQHQLRALIEDVLGFARLEVGQLDFYPADVPLDAMVVTLGEAVSVAFADKQLRLEWQGCPADWSVHADPERLRQIGLNLLANAAKFTAAGGRVTVRAEADRHFVWIAFADSGAGIPKERLEEIFEPFVQVPSSLDERPEGSGLGLAISRDLARAMGGDITVSSTVGVGSTFTLRLPRGKGRVPARPDGAAGVSLRPPALPAGPDPAQGHAPAGTEPEATPAAHPLEPGPEPLPR